MLAGIRTGGTERRRGPGLRAAEPLGYTVDVETNKSVGDSIVPGTEDFKSTASATAVIKPLCTFDLPGEGGDEGDGNDTLPLPQLTCDDDTDWDLDPDDPTTLPAPEDLFDVHLADSQANDE